MTSSSSLRVEWLEVKTKLQPHTEKFWVTLDERSKNITLADFRNSEEFQRWFAEWAAVRSCFCVCIALSFMAQNKR